MFHLSLSRKQKNAQFDVNVNIYLLWTCVCTLWMSNAQLKTEDKRKRNDEEKKKSSALRSSSLKKFHAKIHSTFAYRLTTDNKQRINKHNKNTSVEWKTRCEAMTRWIRFEHFIFALCASLTHFGKFFFFFCYFSLSIIIIIGCGLRTILFSFSYLYMVHQGADYCVREHKTTKSIVIFLWGI